MKKLTIPSKTEKQIKALKNENAELKIKLQVNEQEIADLWYQIITGGTFNVNNG